MFKVIAASAVMASLALVTSARPSDLPYHPGPAHHHVAYDESPKPYAYQYGVHDDYSGANFNAQETADGKGVVGSYQVHLPDGRVQTVSYSADHYNGYVADVKYDGAPVYPKHEPRPYLPGPPRQPVAPLYRPF